MEHAGPAQRRKTCGLLVARALGSARVGGRTAEMIGDAGSHANGTGFDQVHGEDLLPTTQLLPRWRSRPPVAAPCTGNGHRKARVKVAHLGQVDLSYPDPGPLVDENRRPGGARRAVSEGRPPLEPDEPDTTDPSPSSTSLRR
jgi:hypothetical protein